jgi:hypothetical protein
MKSGLIAEADSFYGIKTTFPHWPELINSNPRAKSFMGNVWVMTGLMLSPAWKRPVKRYQVLKSRRPVMP